MAAVKIDSRGLAITTDSDAAVAAVDQFTWEVVSLHGDSAFILEAADANPACAMLQCCAATLAIYSQSKAGAQRARPYLGRARERRGDLTEREALFIDALGAGCAGDFEAALALHERIVARWPRDLLAAKVAEFHCFETGDARRQLALMAQVGAANPDSSHAQSMHGFALELCARREEAEAVARAALRLDPQTPWAEHCLAHVFAGQGRIADGIAALEGFSSNWTRFGHYIEAHNWFHLATLYLAQCDFARALEAYRSHIWGFNPDWITEQTDAILLLWYLELAGCELDGEWRELTPHILPFADEMVFPFLNALYVYALGRAGERERAEKVLESMARHAERAQGGAHEVWGRIGIALARGSFAFACGDYERAAAAFAPILGELWRAGGSDEQRGVFLQSHFVALMRSSARAEAARALERYIAGRPVTPLERRWLDRT